MKKSVASTAVIFLLISLVNASSAFAVSFSKLIVFGDSLSDNGNIYALSSGTAPSSANAYNGRFSDGPVWAEYMAQYLNAGLVDLAQGGAETDDSATAPMGLKKQVSDFTGLMASYPAMAADEALYAVWAGPNDFLGGSLDITGAAANIGDALDMLAGAGAKHILVTNMPNLAATPAAAANPSLAAGGQLLTQSFNNALQGVLDTFQQTYPGITLYAFDIYALFENVEADPSAYGFTNVTGKYVNDDDTVNDDGDAYLFWDSVHPTTAGHKLIAQTIAAQIGADNAAWFASDGMLTIPAVMIGGYSGCYNVVMEYIGAVTGDPDGVYFKLGTISDSGL